MKFGELPVPPMRFGVVRWVQVWAPGSVPSPSLWIGKSHNLTPGKLSAEANCSFRDRPWQAFPITILTGAYIGYAVGSFVARTPLVFGKRIVFTTEDVDDDEKKTN